MQYQGIIYDKSWEAKTGEILIKQDSLIFANIPALSIPKTDLLRFTHGVGIGLIALGFTGITLTFQPLLTPELSYRFKNISRSTTKQNVGQQVLAAQFDQEKEKAAQFAKSVGIEDTYFSIYIPKIDAKASIIKNVNPIDKDAYNEALQKGIAHAAGSSLPGHEGGTYIFAHSTDSPWNINRYNAVFYLLRELNPEEKNEIYVFYRDRLIKYRVAEKIIVNSNDVSWLTQSPSGPERLILQTCWPPGTTWKRLIIVAYPENQQGSGAL